MFSETLLIALNNKRIILVPFGALLVKINFKEKGEKDLRFRKPSQEFGGIKW